MGSGMTSTIAPVHVSPIQGPSRLRSVDIAGPAGRLEALLNEGAADAPYAALVCHPHPLGGGSMHNKVVYHAMKAMNDMAWGLGWPVLRFNFRGTGLSQGMHDGEAEAGDVLAALGWLENEYGHPVVVAGFSFGAAIALKACCGQDHIPSKTRSDVRALVALGLPTNAEGRDYHYPFLSHCPIPKLFLSGDQDQFAPYARWAQIACSAAEPRKLVSLPGADHFFTGQLDPMQHALSGWLKEQLL
jgi:alpha/beta superfamily hydrolase